MSSSPDISLLCPACSGQNAPDSKFCRHCGQSLDGAAIAASPADASAVPVDELALGDEMLPSIASVPTVVTADAVANLEAAALTSPGEIDARHARHLLEKAQSLAGRADVAGAILACRQAIALAPTTAGGHAMLGALLERSGDLNGALHALERAEQLSPDVALSRDVARLREKTAIKPAAPVFHFNDEELFDDNLLPSSTPESAQNVAPAVVAATPAMIAENGPIAMMETESLDAAGEAAPVVVPVTAGVGAENLAPVVVAAPLAEPELASDEVATVETAPVTSGAAGDVPVDFSNFNGLAAALPPSRAGRVDTTPSVFTPSAPQGTPIGARVVAPAATVNPLSLGNIDSAPQGWSALWARPSYFGRSLPLVGATVLALGFLGWARNLADARNLAKAPVVVASAPTSELSPAAPSAPAASASNLPPLAPVGSATAPNGGFPITNQTVAVPPTTPPAAAPNAPQTTVTRTVTTAPPRRTSTRTNNNRNPNFLPPAAIPPSASRNNGNSGGASGVLTLPPPIITPPNNDSPAVSVLPSGSPPLNPAGAAGRGYVRITQGRVGSILPQRPATRASDAERAAANAARGGSTNQAIDGLTNAINANSSDAGFRFQQRAMLFLGQNDYSRAADDFQSAINAYNDQIGRGEQVASARAGLSAARSGLNRALAGGR